MRTALFQVTLVVRDYDEALDFYCGKLGFVRHEDPALGNGKRWVVVGSPDGLGARLLLARAADEVQAQAVGNQAGGRVGFFLQTSDFDASYGKLAENGVLFLEEPREEPYGKVAVFQDLYGNKWDLIEHRARA